MSSTHVKLVVFVPVSHAERVREALGKIGAGKLGNYDFCSFSTKGVGRFRGNAASHPALGEREELTQVDEERIETIVPRSLLAKAIEEVRKVHPYEEVALDVYALENV